MRSCFSLSSAYFMKDKSKSIWSSIGIKSGAMAAEPMAPAENLFVVVRFEGCCSMRQYRLELLARLR